MPEEQYRQLVEENRILLVRAGSHLYGTATAESDEDREGVFIPPEAYVLGLRELDHVDLSIEATDERGRNLPEAVDVTYYSLQKFMRQALKNNPNSLEPLFVNEGNVLFVNSIGRELLEARHLFPHRKLAKRYRGYARGQRRKVKKRAADEPERASRGASHLIRLLKEGIELLETGELQFPLAYGDLICAVKRGDWSIDRVLRLSHELEDELNRAEKRSRLPEEPRFQEINDLTVHLLKEHLALQENR